MATNTNTSFLCITLTIFFFSISPSIANTPPSSPAIVLQLTKATSSYSSQYVTSINLKTHAIPPKFTIDLGGDNLWVVCGGNNFNVSSYRPVSCKTAECKLAEGGCEECYAPPEPGCHRKMCVTIVANRMTNHLLRGELGQDVAFLRSTNGGGVSIPGLLFSCGVWSFLEGLASGVVGMAGLGRSNVALPSLISNAFNLPKKFAICLSPSSNSKGVIIFGDKPYAFPPHSDLSVFLLYTPLILNPYRIPGAFQNDPSPDYFINLTSIRINGKDLALNKTKLSMSKDGFGGTKFSTIKPYTIMHSSIYNVVKNAFAKELIKGSSPWHHLRYATMPTTYRKRKLGLVLLLLISLCITKTFSGEFTGRILWYLSKMGKYCAWDLLTEGFMQKLV